MDAATLNNKRKRKQGDAAADGTKKSKKLKNPPPAEVEREEEDEVEEEEEDAEVEAENEGSDDNGNDNEDGQSEGGSDLEDQAEARNADGDVIPTQSAPIVSTMADSQKFEDLKLSEKTMKAIQEMGFTKMTNIQRSVCPPTQSLRSIGTRLTNLLHYRPFPLSLPARTSSVQPRRVPERRSPS